MISAIRSAALAAALGLWSGAAVAECRSGSFEDVPYTACVVNPAEGELRLWHRAPGGDVFGTFDRLARYLAADGQELTLAMNGGMYHDDRSPVGLYVESGVELGRLVTSEGPGNFGLLPNGVFCLAGDRARVIETLAFADEAPACDFAAQSGPMLVIGGVLHPRLLPDSTSEFIRNGVGVRRDGMVILAISDAPVNFHRFARLFRDALGAPDALYIDGKVSRLYAPELGRHDIGFPIGPIIGTSRAAG